jgi:hypothetical protein
MLLDAPASQTQGSQPMSDSDRSRESLDTLARVLARCTVLGFLLVAVVAAVYVLAGKVLYGLHGGMFGLTNHELDVIFYAWIGSIKLCVILFFLFPWIAIRLVLRRQRVDERNRQVPPQDQTS